MKKLNSAIPFQFHKGTIRTDYTKVVQENSFLFQFHKGTIRTILGYLVVSFLIYFNSIKVQLEPVNP